MFLGVNLVFCWRQFTPVKMEQTGVVSLKESVLKWWQKKSDGTVVKKLFKPIEDSSRESPDSRTNIFVLSKNKDERLQWNLMEIVVIIDRRPKCHIKGISGEKFATTVCCAPTTAYLDRAVSFSYDVGISIKDAVKHIAE